MRLKADVEMRRAQKKIPAPSLIQTDQVSTEKFAAVPAMKHPNTVGFVHEANVAYRLLHAVGAHWPMSFWLQPHPSLTAHHVMFPAAWFPLVLTIIVLWLCWNAGRVTRRLLARWKVLKSKDVKIKHSQPLRKREAGFRAPWDNYSDNVARSTYQEGVEAYPPPDKSPCPLDAMLITTSETASSMHPASRPGFAYGSSMMLLVYVTSLVLLPTYLTFLLNRSPVLTKWAPAWVVLSLTFVIAAVVTPVCYARHFYRLAKRDVLPEAPETVWPLVHAVVITSHEQSVEAITRTCESVAEQSGIGLRPWIVLAGDVLDDREHVMHGVMKVCGNRVGQVLQSWMPETGSAPFMHSLVAHDLHQQLVLQKGIDPFKVMVTLVDAGSLLSSTYLAHIEANFHTETDGAQHIYVAPLVSHHLYQNSLLSQTCEVMRSHTSIFLDPYMHNVPQSNYSITLGCIAEVNLWKTASGASAKVKSLHDLNMKPMESFIFGSPAHSISEAYEQAKQQVDIMALLWQVSLSERTCLIDACWSMFRVARCAGFFSLKVVALSLAFMRWHALPGCVKVCALSWLVLLVWNWVCFWLAEFILWKNVLKQPLVVGQGLLTWLLLVACSPVLMPIAHFAFNIVPTLHFLFVAAWTGRLQVPDEVTTDEKQKGETPDAAITPTPTV